MTRRHQHGPTTRNTRSYLRAIGAAALIGSVVLPLPRLAPTIAQASRVIIQEDVVQPEDFYAFGQRVFVEGVIQGDLIVVGGELVITGTVEGDVLGVVWGKARIAGQVNGSVRLAAGSLDATGTIGDDLAVLTANARLRGDIGRDVLATVAWMEMDGVVRRDVRGQIRTLDLNGRVERDLEVAVGGLDVGTSADVGGDLTYRSSAEATVSAGANVAGQFVHRMSSSPLEIRAFERVVGLISILSFLFAGIVLVWLLRRTSHRASDVALRRPGVAFLAGLGSLVAAPFAVALLGVTLVGIPIAFLLLALLLLALFLGPIPIVTALGGRVMQGRGGIYGAFVIGALLWRGAVWLIPYVGILLYVLAVIWGTGAWVLGAIEARREFMPPPEGPFVRAAAPLPPPPPDWEPPLPPLAADEHVPSQALPDPPPPPDPPPGDWPGAEPPAEPGSTERGE